MFIHLKDGFVCCSLENKNKEFLQDCYKLFDGFIGSDLFISKFNKGKESWGYPEVGTEEDLKSLDWLIENAKKHGISVGKEVFELRDKLNIIVTEAANKRRKREEERKAKELWQTVCKNGCKRCDKLHYVDGEIPCCGYSGDILEERMDGAWSNDMKVFYPFIWVPLPNEHCKYKA